MSKEGWWGSLQKKKKKEGWKLTIEWGFHNHKVMKILFGHSYVGHLSNEEKNMVNQLTKKYGEADQILLTIKYQDQTNLSTIN